MKLIKGGSTCTSPAVQYGLRNFGNIDDPSLEPMMPSAHRIGRPRKATGWCFDLTRLGVVFEHQPLAGRPSTAPRDVRSAFHPQYGSKNS